ncbi:MAG: alpha/beta fold hydrolase [Egibacteraceae bacterium]
MLIVAWALSGSIGAEELAVRSCAVDLGGPVHYVEFGDQQGDPAIVFVHGLGGSWLIWSEVAPTLARRARVLAIDLAGFGRTPLAGRSASVHANQRLLGQFLDKVVGGPAVLVGNSMGGTIAVLEAAAHPERVAGLVLVCPSVPTPAALHSDREVRRIFAALSVPGLGPFLLRQRGRRLGQEGLVREVLQLCCADPGKVSKAAVQALVDLNLDRARMSWADTAYLQGARSLVVLHTRGRWRFLQQIRVIDVPTLLVQGVGDRLASLVAAQQVARMRPDWTFAVLDGVGHLPMLEDPERFLSIIGAWLESRVTTGEAARPLPNDPRIRHADAVPLSTIEGGRDVDHTDRGRAPGS